MVQVHAHNRDAVAGLLEVPDDFEDRERVTIRIWPGAGAEERVLALGSKFGRGMWTRGELLEHARQAPREVGLLVFGEPTVVPVSCSTFQLSDEAFVFPSG